MTYLKKGKTKKKIIHKVATFLFSFLQSFYSIYSDTTLYFSYTSFYIYFYWYISSRLEVQD